MSEIAPSPAPLIHDILCIGCGYNLRGLEPTGRCPECGLAVADSNRGDRLAFADPAWLRKLRFGASLKLWNILVTILIGLTGGVAVGLMGAPAAVMALVGATGAALGLWATFAITTQEPRIALTEDPVTLRKIIRICAVAAFAGLVVQQIEGSSRVAAQAGITAPTAVWGLIGLLVALAGLIVQIGELKYFRRFALRAPDLQLARSTRILMWGLGITYGVTAVGGAAFVWLAPTFAAMGGLAPTTTTTADGITTTVNVTTTVTTPAGATAIGGLPPAAFMAGTCVVGLAFFVFGLWYLILLFRYRKMIHNAAMFALSNSPG